MALEKILIPAVRVPLMSAQTRAALSQLIDLHDEAKLTSRPLTPYGIVFCFSEGLNKPQRMGGCIAEAWGTHKVMRTSLNDCADHIKPIIGYAIASALEDHDLFRLSHNHAKLPAPNSKDSIEHLFFCTKDAVFAKRSFTPANIDGALPIGGDYTLYLNAGASHHGQLGITARMQDFITQSIAADANAYAYAAGLGGPGVDITPADWCIVRQS